MSGYTLNTLNLEIKRLMPGAFEIAFETPAGLTSGGSVLSALRPRHLSLVSAGTGCSCSDGLGSVCVCVIVFYFFFLGGGCCQGIRATSSSRLEREEGSKSCSCQSVERDPLLGWPFKAL